MFFIIAAGDTAHGQTMDYQALRSLVTESLEA